MKIDAVSVSAHRIPLPEPMEGSSTGVMRAFDLVVVRIGNGEGETGLGYTVMHEGQGKAIAAIAENSFRPLLLGEDPRLIERIWRRLWQTHHYAGRGAPLSFALAAVDTALWDLRGRCLGEPLWRLLGGYDPKVKAYAGNIDLNLPQDKLLEGAGRSREQGHRTIKMRLGRPALQEDVARVAAMREFLGPAIELLADANEAWTVPQAAKAMTALEPYDLLWLEEPITPDDFAGQAHLRSLGRIPLAAGENLHTVAEFVQLFRHGAVDYPQPDLTTCGGITPFMRIARLAEANNLPLASHGAAEIHCHLLAACPNAKLLEIHAFGLQEFMAHKLTVTEGYVTAPDRPGHGVELDMEALSRLRV